jgi:N-acyl amino acid synthase of PEP-CTERM/exosortase system
MGAISTAFSGSVFETSNESWQPELSLLARHDIYFQTRLADQPALAQAAYALRYQVYCLERKFENPDEHSRGLESDEYDARAVQGVLFHSPTDRAIGTVRLILPEKCGEMGLPIVQLLGANNIDLEEFVRMKDCVEVSRFAISKEFRRRWTDDRAVAPGHPLLRDDPFRRANLACLSLIQFSLRQCVEREVLYWTAVMEPTLLRMLARIGLRFTSIGPVVFHHGFRQPCYSHIPTVLEEMRVEHPDYWEVVTNAGELSRKMGLPDTVAAPLRHRA